MTNKKFLFIGMAVLLSASLFFLGCDTEGEDTTDKDKDETPAWYAGLGDGLTEAADGTVTLTAANTTLSAALTVPTAKTLKIDANAKLTVPASITVTIEGTGALVGTGATSEVDVNATATVTGLTAGKTYVWYNAGWFDKSVYTAAVTAAAALVGTGGTLDGKASVDGIDPLVVNLTDNTVTIATGSLTVPADVTLVVPSTKTLSITHGATYGGKIKIASGGSLQDGTQRASPVDNVAQSYTFGGLASGSSVTIASGGTYQVNASTTSTADNRSFVGTGETSFINLGTSGTGTVTFTKGSGSVPNVITIGGTGVKIHGVGSSTLNIYPGERLVIDTGAEVATAKTDGGTAGSNINFGGAANVYHAGSVVVKGTLTIGPDTHLEGSDIFKDAVTAGSTGRIVVKPLGAVVRVGAWTYHLVNRTGTGVSDGTARFVWPSEATTGEIVVNFTAKTIVSSLAVNTDEGVPTLANLAFPNDWTETAPNAD
ncbi:MAG: hypothetical protein LBK61_03450 [Spirochaetaceae bacterium]|jgi:hypothetical protein|nr:hypothetical protein [Spirochaetaceae bacterium]